MDTFDVVAGKIITAMETHARKLGVKGVIVVASMDDRGFSWESRMKAVEANRGPCRQSAEERLSGL